MHVPILKKTYSLLVKTSTKDMKAWNSLVIIVLSNHCKFFKDYKFGGTRAIFFIF
jgi:hypothetical protein